MENAKHVMIMTLTLRTFVIEKNVPAYQTVDRMTFSIAFASELYIKPTNPPSL